MLIISILCFVRTKFANSYIFCFILLKINAQTSALQADALFVKFSQVKVISYT